MTKAEERALEAYPVNMTPLVYQDLIDQFGGKTKEYQSSKVGCAVAFV